MPITIFHGVINYRSSQRAWRVTGSDSHLEYTIKATRKVGFWVPCTCWHSKAWNINLDAFSLDQETLMYDFWLVSMHNCTQTWNSASPNSWKEILLSLHFKVTLHSWQFQYCSHWGVFLSFYIFPYCILLVFMNFQALIGSSYYIAIRSCFLIVHFTVILPQILYQTSYFLSFLIWNLYPTHYNIIEYTSGHLFW